jgi:hypothetical protein
MFRNKWHKALQLFNRTNPMAKRAYMIPRVLSPEYAEVRALMTENDPKPTNQKPYETIVKFPHDDFKISMAVKLTDENIRCDLLNAHKGKGQIQEYTGAYFVLEFGRAVKEGRPAKDKLVKDLLNEVPLGRGTTGVYKAEYCSKYKLENIGLDETITLHLALFYAGDAPSGVMRKCLSFGINFLVEKKIVEANGLCYLEAFGKGVGKPSESYETRYLNLVTTYNKMGFQPLISTYVGDILSAIKNQTPLTPAITNPNADPKVRRMPKQWATVMVARIADTIESLDKRFWSV